MLIIRAHPLPVLVSIFILSAVVAIALKVRRAANSVTTKQQLSEKALLQVPATRYPLVIVLPRSITFPFLQLRENFSPAVNSSDLPVMYSAHSSYTVSKLTLSARQDALQPPCVRPRCVREWH